MRRPPLLNTALRQFLLAMVLANIASQMVFSLLPVYLTRLGASVGEVGFVFSIASLVPVFLQIFGGWLSDSIGRLRAIALGALGGSLGYIGFLLAPSWEWVMVALSLEYISGSLVGPSFAAFIAEQSAESTRGRVFGIASGIYLVVGVLGPLLGGFLAQRYGFRPMLSVACALYLSAAALRVWMASAVRVASQTPTQTLSLDSLRASMGKLLILLLGGSVLTWVFITDGVRDVAFRLSSELEPVYFAQVGGLSIGQIGTLSSIYGLAMMIIALPGGWLSDRYSERLIIAGGFFLQFAGLVVFLLAPGFGGFAVSVFVAGLGVGIILPAYDSFVSKAVPQNMRGVAFGMFQTSLSLISLPAPWLGALLWERVNPRAPFLVTAVAAILSVIPVWLKFRLPRTLTQEHAVESGAGA